ncbi:MAG: N-acyl-D-amino-acid deacylase [Parcubacteria group bacterium Gr01-1014_70]|nr:MAG: N-acyl-D-amino-acid deacylase [Parcubacteria group bacterium Gr01-1014_70]
MDILIQNGTIIDGTGKASYIGNVAVTDGKITDIGPRVHGNATTIIDATHLIVCPGFIDITNHSDTHWTLFDYPSQESMLKQGITSIIGGSCGTSLAPLIHGSVSAKSVQKWVDISQINVNWLRLQEFFEELKRHHIGVHFGTLVGHGTLRRNILGDAARPANADETQRMAFLLDQALEEHAFGLSLGLTFSHGRPAGDEELIELAKVIASRDRLLTVHLRDEGKDLLPAIAEVLRIARASGARIHIVHFKSLGRESWEQFSRVLQLIRSGREEGLDLTVNTFPYQRTGSLLYALLPASSRDGGKEIILQAIKNPQNRRLVIENVRQMTLHYDKIVIASAKKSKQIAGKTILQLAQHWDMPPEEALLEILSMNDLAVTVFSDTINAKHMEAIYREPYAYFATDGTGYEKPDSADSFSHNLIHPRSFGASAKFLGEIVRDKSLISWENAISKMTLAPALLLRLQNNRGILKKDAPADITVFDPRTIHDVATYEEPFQFPVGIPWVIVEGNVAVRNGELTGTRAGTMLYAL